MQKDSKNKTSVPLLLLLLLLLLLSLLVGTAQAQVQVSTPSAGVLVGKTTSEGAVDAFLGISYAHVPDGQRFMPSEVLMRGGNETILATEFGPTCHQATIPGYPAPEMSEDCLYLNIWRPNNNGGTDLAVMVWIHGGGFMSGAGSEPLYDGATMAEEQNVLIVSVNYRLGSFGFLAANASGDGKGGMNGIYDQINALKWIQQNIVYFGGDPDNVTIFGESAGGVSTCILSVSPLATSLFKRAIIQSGQCVSGVFLPRTAEQGEEIRARLLTQTGLASVEDLKTMPADDLVVADSMLSQTDVGTGVWPTVDGWVVPEGNTPELYKQGEFNAQDIMVGATTYDDWNLFIPPEFYIPYYASAFEEYVHGLFDAAYGVDISKGVIEAYNASVYDDPTLVSSFAQFNGDFTILCFGQELAATIAERIQGHSYIYTFGHFFEGTDAGAAVVLAVNITESTWASHGAEIPFVFGNLGFNAYSLPVQVQPGQAEVDLSQEMMTRWANFAKTGVPESNTNSVEWTPVPSSVAASQGATEVATMFFSASGGTMSTSSQKTEQCGAIPGVGAFREVHTTESPSGSFSEPPSAVASAPSVSPSAAPSGASSTAPTGAPTSTSSGPMSRPVARLLVLTTMFSVGLI